jgi:fructan beta-fructosidase
MFTHYTKTTIFCCFWLVLITFSCKSTQKMSNSNLEPHRPVYHFTPPAHWMNDPNGMVFYEGEYHLFYQYYPEGTVWGPMHWGHAVSKDLVHWEHLPIALYPDALGLIFSGSAVVDWNNSSGFGENGKPPLVAIFTQHLMEGEKAGRHDFQYQSIAYSNDRGRTWTKYAGNPVIPNVDKIHDFRDPKVIWDDAHQQWLMVFAAYDYTMFWSSKNLKNWTYLSSFGKEYGAHGGVWECPDFFPMYVEPASGATGVQQQKWVLLQSLNPGLPSGGSGTQYFVGDFDGKTFKLDPEFETAVQNGKAVWLDWGRDNYAGVTWSDVPKSDGRRIFLGWMSNWDYANVVPTQNWRSAMTIPRSLTLHKAGAAYRLHAQPVREFEKQRGKKFAYTNQTVSEKLNLSEKAGISPATCELDLEFTPNSKEVELVIELSNSKGESFKIGYDGANNRFFCDRMKSGNLDFSPKFATQVDFAPRFSTHKTIKMHLFFDRASCELFADGGEVAMTEIFFPSEDFSQLTISANKGDVMLHRADLFEIKK